MLVVCARRHGLIANATRWVGFAPLKSGAAERFTRIREVEAAFLHATRPGREVRHVLADGIASYAQHGFAPREWTRHHQGGPTGYFGRDPAATPVVTDTVVLHQAFAWNPSGPGTKCEDTVLLTEAGIECLTVDEEWPTVRTSSGADRPDVMVV